MADMFERIETTVARFTADRSNQYCVHTSLMETALAFGLKAKKLDGVLHNPTISPSECLSAITRGSEFLGMEVIKVWVKPGLIKNDIFVAPHELRSKIIEAIGVQQVGYPNIRILLYKLDGGKRYKLHAECDDNSRKSKRRISQLEKQGWVTGVAVELKRRVK